MKPRVRPLSNLYYRWGKRLGLDAETVARSLEAQKIIIRIDADHYSESPRNKVPHAEFERLVVDTLLAWKECYGLT